MPSWGDRQTMMEEDAALWALLLNINWGEEEEGELAEIWQRKDVYTTT